MLINHVDDDDDVAAPNANGSTAKTEVEATRSRSFNKINTDPNFNDRGAGLHLDLVQDWLSVLLCENRARVNKADETFRLFTNSNTAQHFFTICLRIRLPQEIKYLALEIYNKFMISHLSGLYAMINAKARTENVKKRDWERVLTTVSRQVTLRTLSCIQVASKLHSNKTSMTVERVQSCLRMLGYAYTDESIRSSEVRVLNSCGWCENQLQTPLTYLESFLSVICQINRPHHNLDTQAIWEYALLVMDCVYLNLEEVYRRVARAAHGRQGTLASKPRLLRVEADYALLASGVIVTACICVHGTDFVATVIFSLQKTTGIPRESISDFYTGIYQSVKNYSVMHPLYAWTNPNPCDDSLQNGSSISSRFGTPLKQQKTVSFRNGFSRKLL